MHVRTAWQAVIQCLLAALLASATLGASCYRYVDGSLSDIQAEALDYGPPHYYAALFAECVDAVQATMMDTLAAQWDYSTRDVLVSDSVIQLRDSVALWTVSQPKVRHSVWTLTGWTQGYHKCDCPGHKCDEGVSFRGTRFPTCRRVWVRAAVRDEGAQGVAVRIIARAAYSSQVGHDDYFGGIYKSVRLDPPDFYLVAAIFAALDQRLPRKEPMQHP